MSRFRLIALTALALLPALMLLYVSGKRLFEAWLITRTTGVRTDFALVGVFAAATMACISTTWLARRGTLMSPGRRIALATPALLLALMSIVVFWRALSEVRIIALKYDGESLIVGVAIVVAGLILMLLSSISTLYLAWRSERKPSLDSVF
jgi:hypothetical protein